MQSVLQFISQLLRSGLYAGHPSSLTSYQSHLALCNYAGTRKDLPQTVVSKLEACNCLRCICMLWQQHYPSLEIRGQSLKKQPHTIILPSPNSTVDTDGAMLSGIQAQIGPSDCQKVKCDSSLQRAHFHCSRVQWRSALHHCSQHLALRMVILGLW